MSNSSKKLALVILDGWAIGKDYPGNAITQAKAPFWRHLWADKPHALLEASGEAVGLPEGQMGNSEINHAAIGSGRVIYQDLVKMNKDAREGKFKDNEAFQKAFNNVKENNSSLHIMGMLSPGGVHSHQDHIFALMRAAKQSGVQKIYVHAFTDGRDVLPKSCSDSFIQLQKVCEETGAQLATISGRYYAMDRDHNWDRIDLAYQAIRERVGVEFTNAEAAIQASYNDGKNDEFIVPCLIKVSDEEKAKIHEHDSVVFMNFRNDRPRQLTERFLEKGPKNLIFVTATLYSTDYKNVLVAFSPQSVTNTLGEVLSKNKIRQFRVTETEKFAHLTFFMNCKREEAWPLEDRFMFDSNKVATHDLKPEMKAMKIASKIADEMQKGEYQVILSNICNGDMVGHSGNIPATIQAVETVSKALEIITAAAEKAGYTLIVTADHGNCDEMIDQDGNALSQHSMNPVPFIVVDSKYKKLNRDHGIMADIAPTILKILDIEQPEEMTGKSLV
ncbi:2,3-bisphosphoglycerate-independent phosphoglycerate mutase [Patescibacteria group bacterium]|nr:2,3-bisphosphoglycerate-independent phosphoglycerate mutase [Patescibacteria group bacterium]